MRKAKHLIQSPVPSKTVSSFSFPEVRGTGPWENTSNMKGQLVGKDDSVGCILFPGASVTKYHKLGG